MKNRSIVGFMAPLTRAQVPVFGSTRLQLPLYDEGEGDGTAKKLSDLLKESPELQAEFNETIENRLQRDRRSRGNTGGMTKEEREELDRLKSEAANREQQELEKKKEYEKALGLEKERFANKEKGYQTEREKHLGELAKERVTSRLIAAATRLGAVDPDDVAQLLANRVVMDDNLQPSVRDVKDSSKPAIDARGNDMSIDDLVKELLEKKPHLARAAGGEGGGAQGGSGTQTGSQGTTKGQRDVAALKKVWDDALKAAQADPGNRAKILTAQKAQKAHDDAVKAAK